MSTPTGTYRVQVRPDFGLDTAATLAGYLHTLGVSHMYSAPLLTATPGSPHGYDVVDPRAVNPQLGGAAALDRLVGALKDNGLGLVVDIVPNHMGLFQPAANPMWWDVLKHGRGSEYAGWFDIDWDAGPIIVPVLGSPALDDLAVAHGELRYYEHRFPLAPGTEGGTPPEVHERQHYRLVYWREGNERLNYRRFFAVTELAGLRVEDPAVFEATHTEILRWVREGLVDGIRVDHPDGLRDPGGYLARLREHAPGTWLLVEKILELGEPLPPWPVDGTTGYEALAEACGLFVDPGFSAASDVSWSDEAYAQKLDVTKRLFGAELNRLERLGGDKAVLAELAANFSVYRTYLPYGAEHLDEALAKARTEVPADLVLRLRDPGDELAVRFQQLTGAVMAKGVEDTAMYRWNRLIALNEVGGDPSRVGVGPDEFHAAQARRLREWPHSMTTLSTHDTKRGEDVRARLAVLSEIPADWAAAVGGWRETAPLDDPSFEALFWQTIVGAWPIEQERLRAYFQKAAREANRSTSWDEPDEAFEAAVNTNLERVFDNPDLRHSVHDFAARITPFGWSNALGQKLVQLTMPGVPDVYQGTELWENSLVDPDNRRPVDFAERLDLLAAIDAAAAAQQPLPPVDVSGAAKLLVVSRALRLRRDRPELFGGYEPVGASGPAQQHAVAFDRGGALTVATRLPVALAAAGGWRDTALHLPEGSWTDALTGRGVPSAALGDILATYPVALLVKG
ncbi:malto-oligosyltrehalose synthase [Dactylosporangium matsuzakiense]|uniref:Malto-oligosyltrehalose synthase n=1 Tax=Dactylosporangium matsuzakiense TaxID=53360 RepID=A0A9W6KHJ6_9ACTN|nr:malto-oligosyltrehalose synthase [Dactylosporangium matsuzakiense]UWZ42033.1 malto-oligosyltrehalose synthase [Dactylosporangium matsuzakiense]GLK99648.1 malto-oligosyltrehalose synthase [Dactylosporangium matsuzakiense]